MLNSPSVRGKTAELVSDQRQSMRVDGLQGAHPSLLHDTREYSPSVSFLFAGWKVGDCRIWSFSMWSTRLLLPLFVSVLCEETPVLPDLRPGDAPEPLLKFMEKVYTTGRARTSSEAGEPLILTPLIEQDKLEEARKAAMVESDYILPGVESYAGYLTVNKEYNSNLWFWYFPVSKRSVEETPLIMWLQGGPGASSLYGLFNEIGPFVVNENNNLEEMKYSWAKNHSLLFIDNPVGTGFSFTDDDRGYATNQTTIGENLYDALQQFYKVFPELRKAPLTIAGESYAGKHIPSLAIQIHRRRGQGDPINLQGLAIGNGFMDPVTLQRYSHFVREVGLVEDRVADVMGHLEGAIVEFIKNGDMLKAYAYYNYLLSVFLSESRMGNLYNYLQDKIGIDGAYTEFIQGNEVRKALHVGSTNYTSIGVVYRKLVPDFMRSTKPWLEELIDNYRVMVYSGHLDIIVAYHPSVNTISSLTYTGSSEFAKIKRIPWYHNSRLAGYSKTVGNFTEVMVRGAGHMVPADQPSAALGLISAFTRGLPLDADTGYLSE
ncbi:Venom serine carboxypeptidase [Eumeta japonica]|uniref:Carboxypeptidase n=1 Tax=Eumeta variegata TaxID=151549 RepID=A0A4C1U3F4_EUMVA|nr:Venom serine carboxypeptidase [Eumeta japonica]